MQHWMRAAMAASISLIFLSGTAAVAQSDPPARVGRISFLTGTVSYDDREEGEERHWSPALLNHPFTTGSALWTEPNGRAEVDVAGTRLRLQGATELEAEILDDEQLRLRLPQGRLDVRSTDSASGRPPEILTPRGTVRLMQDGDYVIEAGTTDDPTRIGVRSGLAQFVDANGSVLEVKPGETGVATGASPVVFAVEHVAPPPMPAEWAARDRRVTVYRPTSYVEPAVTGYEDLDAYGYWTDTSDYGQVWVPRDVVPGWAPYRHGRWVWVRPWGWTWVDSAPWGFAPFHYGRWVHRDRRWCWIPPARRMRPVYAPAIVGFVGGAGARPTVGWFPLGPREVYVPPYTRNRTYIRNINVTNVRDVTIIDRRIDYIERHRDRRDHDQERWTYANQRYATVVPADAFRRSRPVSRAALPVERERLAREAVTPVPPDAIGRPERKERPAAPGPAARRTQERKTVVPPDRKPDPPSDKVTPPPKGATPPGKGPGTPPRPDERAKPPAPAGKDQLPAPRAAPRAPERVAPSGTGSNQKARSAPKHESPSRPSPKAAPPQTRPSPKAAPPQTRPAPKSPPPKAAPNTAHKPQGVRSRSAPKPSQRVAPSTATPRATAPRTTRPRATPPHARTPSRPPAKARSAPAPRSQRAPAVPERGR